MVSDDSIIKRLNARDESALHDIRRLYGGMCYQLAFRMLESHEDAEECVNDMHLSVWGSIPPKLPESLQAYLITLVRNSALDKIKHEHRQKRGNAEFSLALDELAEILVLHELTELIAYESCVAVQTIARSNLISETKVKVTLLRVRRKLKDYLRKEGLL